MAETIAAYKQLISKMPKPNQYLLLYVLDLLSVFAKKSDKNLMTASSEWNVDRSSSGRALSPSASARPRNDFPAWNTGPPYAPDDASRARTLAARPRVFDRASRSFPHGDAEGEWTWVTLSEAPI
jgi:hypothetical protein